MTIPQFLYLGDVTVTKIITMFTFGALTGFVVQAWSDLRARQRSGRDDDEIYRVRQERVITLLREPKSALELCVDAVRAIDGIKLTRFDEDEHLVVGRTRLTWESLGSRVEMRVAKIGETLSEITITARPVMQTTAVDNGVGWEIAEKLVNYLRENDASVGKNLLQEGVEIIYSAARRPIAKDFVRLGEKGEVKERNT